MNEQMEAMTDRIVKEALDAVRYEAMTEEVGVRLSELCEEAAEAARTSRVLADQERPLIWFER